MTQAPTQVMKSHKGIGSLSGSSVRLGKRWNFHATAKLRTAAKTAARAETLLLNPAVYAAEKVGREGGNKSGRRKTPTAVSTPIVEASVITRNRLFF
jgi:hypothetical protein